MEPTSLTFICLYSWPLEARDYISKKKNLKISFRSKLLSSKVDNGVIQHCIPVAKEVKIIDKINFCHVRELKQPKSFLVNKLITLCFKKNLIIFGFTLLQRGYGAEVSWTSSGAKTIKSNIYKKICLWQVARLTNKLESF